MQIPNYVIPPECKRISVEATGNRLIITFEPDNAGDFHCKETDHIEELPRIGDLAVVWNDDDLPGAIISRVTDADPIADNNYRYQAASQVWYQNAIRFRSEEQYRLITKR